MMIVMCENNMECYSMTRNGRKIPRELENPFDNILIDFSERLNPFLRRYGVTPNMLTSLALCTGVCAACVIWKGMFVLGATLSLVSYMFDTLDGNMARMFDMVTAFGDLFDHGSDVIKYILLYVAIYVNKFIPTWYTWVFFTVTAFCWSLTAIHIGCQEVAYGQTTVDSLSGFKMLCPKKTMIHYTKYVGIGTWIIVLLMMLCIAEVLKHD
jgi:phosphatidylglycerophosphate synthase